MCIRDRITEWFDQFPYWGVLAFNQGGMASHGGILGSIAACLYVARRGTHVIGPEVAVEAETQTKREHRRRGKECDALEHTPSRRRDKHSFLHILDLASFGAPLGLFFGRIANFINGELYGRHTHDDMLWAVKFPQEIFDWRRDPGRLSPLSDAVEKLGDAKMEAWLDALVTIDALQPIEALTEHQHADWQKAHQVVSETMSELVMQTQSGGGMGEAVRTALEPALTARHPSQLYQAFGEGLLLFIVLALIWAKPRKPGVIAGVFVMVYGILRVAAEQFRMPDSHIGYQLYGLTVSAPNSSPSHVQSPPPCPRRPIRRA